MPALVPNRRTLHLLLLLLLLVSVSLRPNAHTQIETETNTRTNVLCSSIIASFLFLSDVALLSDVFRYPTTCTSEPYDHDRVVNAVGLDVLETLWPNIQVTAALSTPTISAPTPKAPQQMNFGVALTAARPPKE